MILKTRVFSRLKLRSPSTIETVGREMVLKRYELGLWDRLKMLWATKIEIVSLANGEIVPRIYIGKSNKLLK